MFWNVQRLFAPQVGPVGRALDVAASGWSEALYERKLLNLGECLKRLVPAPGPALLGLAEVETPGVVRDLQAAAGLNHHISVDDCAPSQELDALDVALLYDRRVFENQPRLVQSISLDNRFATRDLLRVRLALRGSAAEVEVLVAHWPSRRISEGETLRMAYSVYLRRLAAQILKFSKGDIVAKNGSVELPVADRLLDRWNTPCVIMGDFNDEPFDRSVRAIVSPRRAPS